MTGLRAYTPTSYSVVASCALLYFVVLALVYWLDHLRNHPSLAIATAWILTIGTAVLASVLTIGQPKGVRMIAIIVTTMAALKSVVLLRSRDFSPQRLRFDRWLTFVAIWAGMRPELFTSNQYRALPGVRSLVVRGLVFFLIGFAVLESARGAWSECHSVVFSTALALVGISLMLHFGYLVMLTGGMRAIGVDVAPLFQAPLAAASLTEFWGQRWNIAFTEMTSRVAYRPVASRYGVGAALFCAFLLSGLLHELAISVPVSAGFGLPLAYFAIQGAAVAIERRRERQGLHFGKLKERIWMFAWLVAPLPLLFHPWFLSGVIWPLFGKS